MLLLVVAARVAVENVLLVMVLGLISAMNALKADTMMGHNALNVIRHVLVVQDRSIISVQFAIQGSLYLRGFVLTQEDVLHLLL